MTFIKVAKIITKPIQEQIEKTVDKVKSNITTLTSNTTSLWNNVKQGNINAVLSAKMVDDPDNPVSGFTKILFNAIKYLNVPMSAVYWAGNKIKTGFGNIVGNVSNSINVLGSNHDSLDNVSKTGDFDALSSIEMTDNSDNPVGGFTKALFNIDSNNNSIMLLS